MNSGLPGELAGPVSFPGQEAGGWLLPMLLILSAAWALLRWWRRRRQAPAADPGPRPRLARSPAAVGGVIRALRDRHLAFHTFRDGCHELVEVLKGHFEGVGFGDRTRPPCTRLTARQIAQEVGDRPASRLLTALEGLRFGRAEPRDKDFRSACELALEVVDEGRVR